MPQRIDLREGKSHPAPLWYALPLAILLVSCGPGSGNAVSKNGSSQSIEAQTSSGANAEGDALAVAEGEGARAVAEENDLYSFHYAYPAAVSHIPGLKALLDERLEAQRQQLDKDTRAFKLEAQADGFPYRAYDHHTDWAVVADLPGWLSLSAEQYAYTGGAHGMTTFDSLLWDRQADVPRVPLSLFQSPEALEAAVKPGFCGKLDRQRENKRGTRIDRANPGMFDECIGVASATVLLGSSNRRTFDRVGFLIPPYEAGPYVEGSYEVTMPVTRAVMEAVRPEFRESFTVSR